VRPVTCDQVDDLVAELALGVLDGEVRGAALAHIEHCAPCRLEVARSTEVVETLLLLTPASEPPAGFDTRVLQRLDAVRRTSTPRARRRRRPLSAVLAATVMAVSAVVLLPALVSSGDHSDPVAAASMRTDAGATVGTGFLHRGTPAWIVVTVPGWDRQLQANYAPSTYGVRIERRDGSTSVTPASFDANGTWAGSVTHPADEIATVAIVDDRGRVWCSGRFEN
jgi:hypothetical protein